MAKLKKIKRNYTHFDLAVENHSVTVVPHFMEYMIEDKISSHYDR